MNTKLPLLALALGAAAVSAGCTFPSRGTVYDRSRVGRTMHIDTGDVIAVREVTVSGQQGPIGVTGGGLVGHAAGRQAAGAGASGAGLAGAGGAVVGAIAGSAVEEVVTRRAAQEVTVKLRSGDTIAIVQELKDGPFAVGEHVQVLQGAGGSSLRRL